MAMKKPPFAFGTRRLDCGNALLRHPEQSMEEARLRIQVVARFPARIRIDEMHNVVAQLHHVLCRGALYHDGQDARAVMPAPFMISYGLHNLAAADLRPCIAEVEVGLHWLFGTAPSREQIRGRTVELGFPADRHPIRNNIVVR